MLFVFGSLNNDLVMNAPVLPKKGQTVTNAEFHQVYGGKGANQALAGRLSQKEVRVAFAGAVGTDNVGQVYSQYLASHGIFTFIQQHEGPTGTAVVIVGEGDNQIVVAPGANLKAKALADPMIDTLLALGDATVLMQMEVPLAENIALIERAGAKAHAVAIALDRQEKATEGGRDVDHSAVQYVSRVLGLNVCCIARLDDLLQYLSDHSAHGVGEHHARVLAYRERYGVF